MTPSELDDLIATLNDIGTWECKVWRESIFRTHPVLAPILVPGYRRVADVKGYIEANAWLRELRPKLRIGCTPLTLGSHDEAIKDYAKSLAKTLNLEIYQALRNCLPSSVYKSLKGSLGKSGVSCDLPQNATEDQILAHLKRFCDEQWWQKKFKRIQRRGYEAIARELGHVNKHGAIYVSELSMHRHAEQKKTNRALLEMLQAENEDGQTYTLAGLADLGTSNPVHRRSELMVRMRGFEGFAKNSEEDYTGVFITLTCPSKYHAVGSSGRLNPKFNGSSPIQAQAYLNGVWQKARAAFHRQEIQPFGMRVAEPHHDGTPHWHLVLFIQSNAARCAVDILRAYAMEEDGEEPGAAKHRMKVEYIDPAKGSATGYIAKYISKNIDGFGVDADHYGRDAIKSAMRIEAWASIWGIRQFQQIGGAGVTIYRELRRIPKGEIENKEIEAIRAAADEGDWEGYTRLMGGVHCLRKDRPLKPFMEVKKEPNKYGELAKVLKGVISGAELFISRCHTWFISQLPATLIRGFSGDSPYKGITDTEYPYKGCDPGEDPYKEGGHKENFSFEVAPSGGASLEYCQ